MRRPELDQMLETMLASQPEISDLLFTVDRPPQVEAYGELKPVTLDPPIEKLTPYQTETIALNIIGDNLWQIEDLLRHGSCDASYALSDKARFRVNVFSQRGNYSIVCRQLNAAIPTLEQLKFPEIFKRNPKGKNRPGARHRRHRFRQIHHAGRHSERNQRVQARPHRHPGRPG